jgi:hypothetical protein
MNLMMVGEKKKTALILAFSPRRRNRCFRVWSIWALRLRVVQGFNARIFRGILILTFTPRRKALFPRRINWGAMDLLWFRGLVAENM